MISKPLIRQLLLFGIIGLIATGVHYFVALVGHEIISINVYWANFLGYACAVVVSFLGHGKITFQSEISRYVFIRFALMSISALIFSEAILVLLEQHTNVPYRYSLVIVVLSIPIFSFVLAKFWVFK